LQEAGANLTIGGSYVSKYQKKDTIPYIDMEEMQMYMYNLPKWVGAGSVRTQLQIKGWNAMVEYAYKANDPSILNDYSYEHGEALMMSLSYSQKGLAIIAQAKRSENMSFRSDRQANLMCGTINHLPPFANQHTYMLTSLYPYGTEKTGNEWAFQGEIRYTWKRGTKMGGKYGTTLKLNASHIRGTTDTWFGMSEAPYYTDVNLELNKKLTKQWTIGAMAMYQTYNKQVIEGKGDLIRAGIGVVEAKYALNKKIQMRAEAQYMYTKQDEGQWVAALYELSLWRQLVISGQWMYNFVDGKAKNEERQHYYTVAATYTHGAHRVMAGYTKTRAGFNCSGGVCRYVPKQEGVSLTYNFTW
jgi:predicted lipoprotein with Yx(FWY)xxD motif